jgi:DNA-binding LacI/PurR family transcriptional regulator
VKLKKRPTQADVARRAGVSRGTVSLVLNRTASRVPISQETQERVLAAAKELGYSPNPVAQMLARGTTGIIGIFPFEGTFPYTPADFYYPYLVGIEREAGAQGYNVLLFTRKQADTPYRVDQDGTHSLRLADGLILTGNYPDPRVLRWLLEEDYSFVLIGRSKLPLNELDTVVNDHRPCSYEASRHLIDLNHRHLGFVVDDLSLAYHQERLAGCQKAVDEASNAYLTVLDSQALTSTVEFTNTIRQHRISALLCADRRLVPRIVCVIQETDLQIPDDLSLVFLVTSTGNLPFANPTRVKLNRDVKGRVATQRLIKRLEGSLTGYQQMQDPCQFVIGNTTAPR